MVTDLQNTIHITRKKQRKIIKDPIKEIKLVQERTETGIVFARSKRHHEYLNKCSRSMINIHILIIKKLRSNQ